MLVVLVGQEWPWVWMQVGRSYWGDRKWILSLKTSRGGALGSNYGNRQQ